MESGGNQNTSGTRTTEPVDADLRPRIPVSVVTKIFVLPPHGLSLGHASTDRCPVVRCGVSMGEMIAQVYASRSPDQLSALVLADTVSPTVLSQRDRLA